MPKKKLKKSRLKKRGGKTYNYSSDDFGDSRIEGKKWGNKAFNEGGYSLGVNGSTVTGHVGGKPVVIQLANHDDATAFYNSVKTQCHKDFLNW